MKTQDYRASLLKRLGNPDYAVGYLTDVLAEESQEAFLIALKDVIDARKDNISELSEQSGVTRQGLYRALSRAGNPRLSTLKQILETLGLQLSVTKKQAA